MHLHTPYIFALMLGFASAVQGQIDPPNHDAAVALRSLSGSAQPTKAWIADFAAFAASHPGHWIVGHCAQPCLSEAEAEQTAQADAANRVFEILQNQWRAGYFNQQWLHDRLLADIGAGALADDELSERFDRPYGTVWTDTVLLDASPAKLDPLADRYRAELQARHQRTAKLQFAALALAGSVWMAYLLVNTITKGYFTLRLRLIAGTVTALAFWVLLGGP
jgi:hypothetical protein